MIFKVDLDLFFYNTVARTVIELLFFAFLIIFFLTEVSSSLPSLLKVVLVAFIFFYIFLDIYSYKKKKMICEDFRIQLSSERIYFCGSDIEKGVRYSDLLMKDLRLRKGKVVKFKLVGKDGWNVKLKNIHEMQILYEELMSRGVKAA